MSTTEITPDIQAQVAENNRLERPYKLGGTSGKGFMPGVSGNPGGRPKNSVTEHLREALENGAAEPLAKRLIEIATNAKPEIAVQAIDNIQDRTEGKPVQQGRVEFSFDERSLQAIAELSARFLPETIEGEVVQSTSLELPSGTE